MAESQVRYDNGDRHRSRCWCKDAKPVKVRCACGVRLDVVVTMPLSAQGGERAEHYISSRLTPSVGNALEVAIADGRHAEMDEVVRSARESTTHGGGAVLDDSINEAHAVSYDCRKCGRTNSVKFRQLERRVIQRSRNGGGVLEFGVDL